MTDCPHDDRPDLCPMCEIDRLRVENERLRLNWHDAEAQLNDVERDRDRQFKALYEKLDRFTTCTCPSGGGSLSWPCHVHAGETINALQDRVKEAEVELETKQIHITNLQDMVDHHRTRYESAEARVAEMERERGEWMGWGTPPLMTPKPLDR